MRASQVPLSMVNPDAHRAGCSTAGEIFATGVYDGSLAVTAVAWEKIRVQQFSTYLSESA